MAKFPAMNRGASAAKENFGYLNGGRLIISSLFVRCFVGVKVGLVDAAISFMDYPSPSDPRTEKVRSRLGESADLKRRCAEVCIPDILRAVELIAATFRSGGKILLCGNGGSAADCQHMATEFVSRLKKDIDRPPLAAIALTTDTSFLTAFSNDESFEGVFARQVEAIGKAGDVLIGISTSGESRNVLAALEQGRRLGLKNIALTGAGGRLQTTAHVAIVVPSTNTQYIQESHVAIEHIICELVESDLFGYD